MWGEGTLASPSSRSPGALDLPPWATQASPPIILATPAPTRRIRFLFELYGDTRPTILGLLSFRLHFSSLKRIYKQSASYLSSLKRRLTPISTRKSPMNVTALTLKQATLPGSATILGQRSPRG